MKLSRSVIPILLAGGLVLSLMPSPVWAQNALRDSLKLELTKHKDDTTRVILLYTLAFRNAGVDADTAHRYSQEALELAEKLNYKQGIFWSTITLSASLGVLGNYPLSLDYGMKALTLATRSNQDLHLAFANGNLSECYFFIGDYANSLRYERACVEIVEQSSFHSNLYFMWIQLSRIFHAMNQPDSALVYGRMAFRKIEPMGFAYAECVVASVLGNAFAATAVYDSALHFYRRGLVLSSQLGTETDLVDNYNGIATVHKSLDNMDSALWYARKVVTRKVVKSYPTGVLRAANLMVEIYREKNQADSALKYLSIAGTLKDSLFSREKTIAVQNLIYKEQEKAREIAAVKAQIRSQVQFYGALVVLLLAATSALLWLKNRRQRQLQEIRNSIADDLHDDIGSTLSSIGIMSELAKQRSPESSSILNAIGESTTSMQENMSDIVWAIKGEDESLDNVLLRMKRFGDEIFSVRSVAFDFRSDVPNGATRLSMQQRKNLFLLYKEAVNNAAKYADSTTVWVSVGQKDRYITLAVRDNGKGFDPAGPTSGNGLNSMRKRATELDADFRIDSDKDNGTTVFLNFRIH